MSNESKSLDMSLFNAPIEGRQSSSFRNVYANTCRVGIGPWDIRISFGQVVEIAPGRSVNEDEVTIIMSPQQAKAVLQGWKESIERYEAAFGEIPNPALVIEKARAAAKADADSKEKH
jgi:hypothetical protein